jgi:flavodoxin
MVETVEKGVDMNNSIVIYGSHYGNTKRIAEAIADGLRSCRAVQVFPVEEAPVILPARTDLVVIGGPTEQHQMTEAVVRFCDRMAPGALRDVAVAAFDTRLRWPRWLSGSAAAGIAKRLRQAGALVIAPPESFFVQGTAATPGGKVPELEAGELERATAWGASLAASLASGKAEIGAPPVGAV